MHGHLYFLTHVVPYFFVLILAIKVALLGLLVASASST